MHVVGEEERHDRVEEAHFEAADDRENDDDHHRKHDRTDTVV